MRVLLLMLLKRIMRRRSGRRLAEWGKLIGVLREAVRGRRSGGGGGESSRQRNGRS